MKNSVNSAEVRFVKYQYLAKHYASKLFNTERLAMTEDDLVQEFSIKLYEIILAFEKSMARFEQTGSRKPIPLPFYIKSSMKNFVRDYIKEIESDKSKSVVAVGSLSDGETNVDYASYTDTTSEIELDSLIIRMNGFDFMAGLTRVQKHIFCLYVKGMSVDKLHEVFKDKYDVDNKKIDVKKFIKERKDYLKANKESFFPENKQEYFVYQTVEEA